MLNMNNQKKSKMVKSLKDSKKSQFLAQLLILSQCLNQGALFEGEAEGEAGVPRKKNPITYV